jgi:nucleotide-binding universal stress UspA family protein
MKLLFPLDGSEATYQALERGLQVFASVPKVSATFLVVMSKGLRDMPKEAREHLEFDDEDELFIRDDEAKAVVQRATEIAKRLKFKDAKGVVLTGKVKESIIAEAAKHDVLVMHALDRDERAEKRRGSALEEIARSAGCSVFLVRV